MSSGILGERGGPASPEGPSIHSSLDEGGQVLIVVWSCDEEAGWASREQDAGASGASPGASPRIILEFDVLDVREGASRLRQGASGASRRS